MMAQSHTALRAIRGLLGKCQRGSHRERHLPPHPVPTAIELRRNGFFPILIVILLFLNNRTCRRLFPLPVGEGQGEGIGLPFDTATWTLSEIVELHESTGSAGGSHDNEPRTDHSALRTGTGAGLPFSTGRTPFVGEGGGGAVS